MTKWTPIKYPIDAIWRQDVNSIYTFYSSKKREKINALCVYFSFYFLFIFYNFIDNFITLIIIQYKYKYKYKYKYIITKSYNFTLYEQVYSESLSHSSSSNSSPTGFNIIFPVTSSHLPITSCSIL